VIRVVSFLVSYGVCFPEHTVINYFVLFVFVYMYVIPLCYAMLLVTNMEKIHRSQLRRFYY
jgi:hypothetical protein